MGDWDVQAVRDAMVEEAGQLPVDVRRVRLEGHEVIVEFTASTRPGCEFVYRWPATPGLEDSEETPTSWASIGRVNLTEIIEAADYGLPQDCPPGAPFEVSFESCRR